MMTIPLLFNLLGDAAGSRVKEPIDFPRNEISCGDVGMRAEGEAKPSQSLDFVADLHCILARAGSPYR